MKKSRATRRALISSVAAMILCTAMFIGTTFAWFTDTASTGVSRVQSGKLEVSLVDTEGNPLPDLLQWKKAVTDGTEGQTGEEILWEPGATYELPSFYVKNTGTLAFRYQVKIKGLNGTNSTEETKKLLEAIDFKVTVGGATVDNGTAGADETGTILDNQALLPAGSTPKTGETAEVGQSKLITVSGTMKPEAGNQYQGQSLKGISIAVVAKQYTYESDSKDQNYDQDATYPVLDADDLKKAVEAGGNLVVEENLSIVPSELDTTKQNLYPQMTVTKDTVLDLNGKTIGVDASDPENLGSNHDYGKASPLLMAVMGGTLTINGNGTVYCEAGNNQVYGINVNGGKAVINGGSFYGAMTAIQVQKGSLEINGGFFDMAPTCKKAVPQYAKYVVNCIDSAYKDGTATVTIKGGTFVNFDPSANPEGAGTTYVANGYKVVTEEQANGDIWYTVVPQQ